MTVDPRLGTFRHFAPCIVGLEVRTSTDVLGFGTAFHIGDGVLVTARHVVEGSEIESVVLDPSASMDLGSIRIVYPDDPSVDIALLVSDFTVTTTARQFGPDVVQAASHIQLGGHLNDVIDNGLILLPVTVFGFPHISTSLERTLVAARGEVNAIVNTYLGDTRNPKFIISPMARGGFSGGPVLLDDRWLLGIVTESLGENLNPAELGYHAAVTVEPLFDLLFENSIFPATNVNAMYDLRRGWDYDGERIPLDQATKIRIDDGEGWQL